MLTTLINLCAVIWFVLGTTANFQRSMDLISTVILAYFGVPSVVLIILSAILIFKSWRPSSLWGILGIMVVIVSMLSLSPTLFKYVNTSGWLTEHVTTDTLQVTNDGRYAYQLEWINRFQRNSYARLYLKSLSIEEETRIPLDMKVSQIKAITVNTTDNYWIRLEQSSGPDYYLLHTTESFPLKYIFNVDVRKGTAELVQ